MTGVIIQKVIKEKWETNKNNTILTPRVDIPFWAYLIPSKHIQQ